MKNMRYLWERDRKLREREKGGGIILFNRIGDLKLKKYDTQKELRLVMELYNKYLKP